MSGAESKNSKLKIMIQDILNRANQLIWNGERPLDALKTACNEVLAYVSYEDAPRHEYEVTLFQGGNFPVSIDSGIWITGWI